MKNMCFFIIAILFFSTNQAYAQEMADDTSQQNNFQTLFEKMETQGFVQVIITLDVPFTPIGELNQKKLDKQLSNIKEVQNELREILSSSEDVQNIIGLKYAPIVGLQIKDITTLEILESSELVVFIEEDIPVPHALDRSIPQIDVDDAWTDGFTGQGQTIAIIDTGVDGTHSFLTGKVTEEACFSTDNSVASNMCPNNLNQMIGVGAGMPCTHADCNHGTHVAGIAAGDGTFPGVARDAELIAIQVFSLINSASTCNPSPTPCIQTFPFDYMRALDHVIALSSTVTISSVNLSLGGGSHNTPCDIGGVKPQVDNLRSLGIASVIAAGNDGFLNAVGSPGCISTAITVGAVNDNDQMAAFSNRVDFLDFVAPGVDIFSSVPGNGFTNFQGTSMATPHVAGAWAILKQADPNASVDEIANSLHNTAVNIQDTSLPTGSGLVFDRIDVGDARSNLSSPPPAPGGGGCLIATAAYGSELAPQVQQLRELRDNTLLQTESGTSFMTGFNGFYYSFSPAIADLERESPIFKELVKLTITPMLSSLSILNYVDIDSESEILGYGIGIIMLNVGMYFGLPVFGIIGLRKIR